MHAIIMAGGSGTRFWPYSRKDRPKQFLNISGDEPMLVETCKRLGPVVPDEKMIVILGKGHLKEAQRLLKDSKIHILAEPVGRNTAPCIGLGAIYARYLGCEGAVAFLPADHFIGRPEAFLKALEQAGEVAESGAIVTLGIVPTRPETGYGYIKRLKSTNGSQESSVYEVSKFVEKPNLEEAEEYLRDGNYFWNAGIFVASPETILNETEKHLPGLYGGLVSLQDSLGGGSFENRFKEVYQDIESISFDYGIMEKTKAPVYVVPCECGWSDVGSWESLYKLREEDHDENGNFSQGDSILIDCKKSFISGLSGRLVACIGLENCVVVDTDDALLVADIKKSQDIRKIIDRLMKDNRKDLL
jgi:mannose-1-phosphate guanylyltransferase